VKAIYSAVN